MAFVRADACRVACEHAGSEPPLVLLAVPALSCGAAPLLCLAAVLVAPAALAELWAAGC